MKTRIFISVTIAMFFNMAVNANVWRISNITGADAHFTSIQDANDSHLVAQGDTLYIEPSSVSYGSATLKKSLVIIGNGYFLDQNPETQANKNISKTGTITFDTGSAGSAIMGCSTGSITISSSVTNIIIERNRIEGKISIGSSCSDIVITRNYITYSSTSYAIYAGADDIFNLLIYGNYIENTYTMGNSRAIRLTSPSSSGLIENIIENNVIYNGVTIENSEFNNNILRDGTFNATNCSYLNNIGNSDQFGTENGNQQNVDMFYVFIGDNSEGGTTDGQWQLREGSPAIGAGTNGVDCGMFDGLYPYILSGIPDIPAIFEYQQVYNNKKQEVEVTFSVKSNN
ncbi:MAG: hypothetical protein WD577_04225 [Bacteroidales bacterium]